MSSEVTQHTLESLCLLVVDCPHATPAWTDSGVVVLRNQNIKGGRLDLSNPSFTDEAHYLGRIRRAVPQAGDLVITREAPMGEVCQIPVGLKCCLGQRQVLLRPDPAKVDSRFLLYALQSPYLQQQIGWNEGTGSTVSNLRIPVLEALRVPTPPLSVQQDVAETLSALDNRITLLRETNATLEAIAQALFKSWFVDFDPVRAKMEGRVPEGTDEKTAALFSNRFDDSLLGQIPHDWQCVPLTEMAEVTMGNSPKGDSYNTDGIGVPLVNGPVEFGDYFPVKSKWTTEASRFAAADDIILCVRGSTTGRRVVSDDEYCIGRGVCSIRARNGHHAFLQQSINLGLERLLSKTTGSVFPSLSGPDIKNFIVLKPSPVVLDAYETSIGPLLERIKTNHRQMQTLGEIRDTLLPRLTSGQLRLPQAQVELETADAV